MLISFIVLLKSRSQNNEYYEPCRWVLIRDINCLGTERCHRIQPDDIKGHVGGRHSTPEQLCPGVVERFLVSD